MNARLFMIPVLGLALVACSGCGGQPLAPKVPDDPSTAPTSVTLAGVTLTLQTELWRDFMPFSPPDGRPMNGLFQVRSTSGSPLPAGLAIVRAAVIYQGQSWVSVPESVPSTDPAVLMAVSRGGPKWGPRVTVDVVVTLSLGGRQRVMLGARDQMIGATY